jgi:putative NADH-flavin reductase
MAAVVVFGAAGKGGRLIVSEAAGRGHDVVAVLRSDRPDEVWPDGVRVVIGDVTSAESVRELVPNADAIVVAVGGPGRSIWKDAALTLLAEIASLEGPRPRIIHMGGGASLQMPDGRRILDAVEIPEAYLDAANGQADALETYRAAEGVTWTYFSPPPLNFFDGDRTGTYRTGSDSPVVDDQGESRLSYQDFAVVVVDEIEDPKHVNQRFTAAY